MHTCAWIWFLLTRNSWFRNDASKWVAGEPLWDYTLNYWMQSSRKDAARVCVFLCVMYTVSPPSSDWLYHPSHLPQFRQLLHSLLVFFSKYKHSHLIPSQCYLSLWGHLVAVLSNKLHCCLSQPNAHLTCQRPLQVSNLWGVIGVLTYSDTPTRPSSSSDHECWGWVVISI